MSRQVYLAAALLLAAVTPSGAQQQPDGNRFTVVDVIPHGQLDEPMAFEVLKDGTVYVIERKGRLMMYDPATRSTVRVDSIAIGHTYVDAGARPREAEEGLVGFTVAPDFEQNHFAYFIYAHPTIAKHVLSRMELRGSTLNRESEKVMLEWDVQREQCCHTGGGMTWDAHGNLYITVGNNSANSLGSQTDQRPGRMVWDDQRGAANTNDLRGKILRIHPEPDGTYTIPEGNLFPPGTPGTRPEIYTMGHRNAWRPSIDSQTGWLYWGEVGPDAVTDAPHTLAGEDELNQARGPGFFGWPYFLGTNRAYPILDYASCQNDAAPSTCTILPGKDAAKPINASRWNTGLRELPPAQPAFISYPYGPTERFPEVGSGGRSANGGPIFRRADFAGAARAWPEYFEGKWIASDFSRGWIMAITMDGKGDYAGMERILTDYRPVEPIDMKFGPDGDLYVLEYGAVWFAKSPDARLVRIEYNGGNRAPEVRVTSSVRGGTVPFDVRLSAAASTDPDGDALSYAWSIQPAEGGAARTASGAEPTVSFSQPGVYAAVVTVRDAAGAVATKSIRIVAGNREPEVAVELPGGNATFFFPGKPLDYHVRVTDAEDGTIDERVAFSVDYVSSAFDVATLSLGDSAVNGSTQHAVAFAAIANSDCRVCHQPAAASAGPAFAEIATRYAEDDSAAARLVRSIREGSTGKWGQMVMPAHAGLAAAEAEAIARYILSVTSTGYRSRPLAGTITPTVPAGDNGRGRLVLRAAYTDRGAGSLAPQTAEKTLVLRSPQIDPGSAEIIVRADTRLNRSSGLTSVIPLDGGQIGFRQVDLTGIAALELSAPASEREGNVGGSIELRLGSPTGQLVGQVQVPGPLPAGQPAPGGGGRPMNRALPARIEIPAAITGVQDLYLVFRNPQAKPTDPLMTVNLLRVVPR